MDSISTQHDRASSSSGSGRSLFPLLAATMIVAGAAVAAEPAAAPSATPSGATYDLFARSNLVAWCIVPFDAKKRGPEERAALLERLDLRLFAYDYRAEHIPTFDAELEALRRHRITLFAWWFPTTLNDEARLILNVLQRHRVRAQLWVTGGGDPAQNAAEQNARVEAEAGRVRTIAVEAAKIGCTVALYNHGGWFGEPENQLAIIERLRAAGVTNVGLVYNLHHGHDHLDRFPELLRLMAPHLCALNLNGMVRDADRLGRKILPLAQGELDLRLLKAIRESPWRGPVGILNHTDEDAEARLRDNLDGLAWLVAQLEGRPAGPRPTPRSWLEPPRANALATNAPPVTDYWAVEDAQARAKLPLHQTIPPATTAELTPASGAFQPKKFLTWHRSHGDNGGARYSAIDQINRRNVTNLRVAWVYHAGGPTGNIQCNPIIVHGVMFAPTPGKQLVAVDAATGVELWRFKPDGRPAFRGLIYWPGSDAAPERVLFCAGRHLYALNPKDGHPILSFGNGGRTVLPGVAQGDFGAATAAPAIFERFIVVPGFEKDVWGFDVVTGAHRWTFHTVPQPGEAGHDTWDQPESYSANCWGGMALDDTRGIAFITTGSPKPNFVGVAHRGRNLFANALLALDARTGRPLWHFQEIAHDIWDLDIPAPPNLTTITRDRRRVDVVAAVTKIGNTLLLDRVTGKLVFPFRLRRAPASDLRGEQTWPYQPDVELPEPFAKQEFTLDDVTDRSTDARDYILGRVQSATLGWFRPFTEGKPNLYFGLHGGAEWTGACVDPVSGRLYVSANHIPWIIAVFRDDEPPYDPNAPPTPGQRIFEQTCAACHGVDRVGLGTCPPLRGLRHRLKEEEVINQVRNGKNTMPSNPQLSDEELKVLLDFLFLRDRPIPPAPAKPERPIYSFNGYPKLLDHEGYPGSKPPWGTLNCLDLNTGRLVWRVPLGEHEELTAEGVRKTGTENFGGPIVTAGGLVFCAGTRDSKIRAFDADTGQELWSARLPWVGSAPPATYQVNGRQFIVIAATGGGKLATPTGDAYVAFALPNRAEGSVPGF